MSSALNSAVQISLNSNQWQGKWSNEFFYKLNNYSVPIYERYLIKSNLMLNYNNRFQLNSICVNNFHWKIKKECISSYLMRNNWNRISNLFFKLIYKVFCNILFKIAIVYSDPSIPTMSFRESEENNSISTLLNKRFFSMDCNNNVWNFKSPRDRCFWSALLSSSSKFLTDEKKIVK